MSDCPVKNPDEIFIGNSPENRTHVGCPNISWQSSPLAITAVFAKLLTEYFGDPSNFVNTELRNLIKSGSPVITQLDSSNAKETGKLPRISVEFEGSELANMEFAGKNSLGYNIHNSQEGFYVVWNIQHKIEIVAATKRAVLLLSEEVCKLFTHYRKAIIAALNAHNFKVVRLAGSKSVSEEDSSRGYIASIDLLTVAPDHWYVVDISPRLKRVVPVIDGS